MFTITQNGETRAATFREVYPLFKEEDRSWKSTLETLKFIMHANETCPVLFDDGTGCVIRYQSQE